MSCTDKMYLTGNEICSDNPRDLSDNARVFDAYVNSAEFSVTDRFGVDRLTLIGIQNKADSAIVDFTGDAQTAIDGFEQLIDDKIIAQGGVEIANEWGDSPDKTLSQGFIQGNLGYVTPEMFLHISESYTDALNKAINYAYVNNIPKVTTQASYITLTSPIGLHSNICYDFSNTVITLDGGGGFTPYITNKNNSHLIPSNWGEVYYNLSYAKNNNLEMGFISKDSLSSSKELFLNNVAGLKSGDILILSNGYCDMWRVMEKAEDNQWTKWVNPEADLWRTEIVTIAKVNIITNTVILDEPLKFNYLLEPALTGAITDENNIEAFLPWNKPSFVMLTGAKNFSLKLGEVVNNSNRHTFYAYLAYNFSLEIGESIGLNKAVHISSCTSSNIKNVTALNKATASFTVGRGSSYFYIENIKTKYYNSDTSFLIFEGANSNIINGVFAEGSKDASGECIGVYLNTCYNNKVSNVIVDGLKSAVMFGFNLGQNIIHNLTSINCDKVVTYFRSYSCHLSRVNISNTCKSSANEQIFNISQSFDIGIDGMQSTGVPAAGRSHVYQSYGIEIVNSDISNNLEISSFDDFKYNKDVKTLRLVNSSIGGNLNHYPTWKAGVLDVNRTIELLGCIVRGFTHISNIDNNVIRDSKLGNKALNTSAFSLSGSKFNTLQGSKLISSHSSLDFNKGGGDGSEAGSAIMFIDNTLFDSPSIYVNYNHAETEYFKGIVNYRDTVISAVSNIQSLPTPEYRYLKNINGVLKLI